MKRTIFAVLAFVSVLGAQYPPSTNARSLQGRRISSTAPNNGEVLAYLSATGQWTPTAVGAAGVDAVTGASTLTSASVIPRVSAAGVLGPSKLYDWGSTNPVQLEGTNFEVLNRSVLGSESLNETDFATHAKWDVTGDMDDSGGNAKYTYNTGAGTLKQTAANLAVALVANRHYVFTYTVSGKSGDVACTIDTTAAAATQYGSETRTLTLTNGEQTTYFKSAATVTDFGLSWTSTSGGVTIDNLSLKEVQGGNFIASGQYLGGGSSGIKVKADGKVGIGTTEPEALLEVKTADGVATVIANGASGKLRVFGYFDGTYGAHLQALLAGGGYGPLSFNGSVYHFGTGNFGIGNTSPDRLFHAEYGLATSGTTGYVQRLTRTCAGAGGCAANDGAGLEFEVETATGGTNHIAGSIEARWTTATAGSEDGRLDFYTTKAGAETLAFTIDQDGSAKWVNGAEGACDASNRGRVVMVQGGAGVADTFRICKKDAADAYAWTALY